MHYDLSLRKSVDAVNNIMDIGFEASMNVHKAHYGKKLNFYVLELKDLSWVTLKCHTCRVEELEKWYLNVSPLQKVK